MHSTKTDVVTLADEQGNTLLEFVPGRGGLLNKLFLRDDKGRVLDVLFGIDNADELASNPTFKNIPLFPFPNRLRDGEYDFEGQRYQFPLNEGSVNNNLHGFVFDEAFEVVASKVESGHAELTLKYDYLGQFEYLSLIHI